MRERLILFLVCAVAIISGAYLASTVTTNSPYEASSQLLWSFFITLFLFLAATLGIIWYIIRLRIFSKRIPQVFMVSLRQATLLSLVITISIFFNTLGIFQTWDILPLCVAAILIEFFFQAEKKAHARLTSNEI